MKNWKYHPSPWIGKKLREKLKHFPRENDITFSFLRILWNGTLRLILKGYFRLSIEGKDHLPNGQRFVIVANHTSHLDSICLIAGVPLKSINRTYSVAAKDYFFSSFWKSFFSAVFINAIPFDRYKKQRKSLSYCTDIIKEKNQILIMFPEGTRSNSGDIQPFKPGIGLLVAGTETLVVPAYIKGAYHAWPKKNWFPLPLKVEVKFGEPKTFAHIEPTKDGFIKIASELEKELKKLKQRNYYA